MGLIEYRTMYPGLPEVELFEPSGPTLDGRPYKVLIARAPLRYVLRSPAPARSRRTPPMSYSL